MLVPYERTHALPATAAVEVTPSESIVTQTLDHRTVFSLQDTPFTFIPLLSTRVFNSKISSIVRMDNRRLESGSAIQGTSQQPVRYDLPDWQSSFPGFESFC